MTRLNVFKSVRTRYVTALCLVALLSTSAYALLSRVIGAQADNAAVINVSGRQRMLSQRTALLAQQLALTQDAATRARVRAELSAAVDLMARSHLGLLYGDAELHLPGNPPPAVAALYFGPTALDRRVQDHIARIRRLLAAPDGSLTPENPDLQAILDTAPDGLLASLNAAVSRYEQEATRQVAQLQRLETAVLLVTLATLLLEGLLIFRPMEREIGRRNARLLYNAQHDALTGLPNRAFFTERLAGAMRRFEDDPAAGYAVLFLDLNRFKVINDSLGHAVGDQLLVAFSERLRRCVREGDLVARLGGDEFTILLENVTSLAVAERLAERINGVLEQTVRVGEHTLHVSTSIGIVLADRGQRRPEDVLRDADIAMYRAKVSGAVGFEVFTSAMRERAFHVMALETDLRGAAARGELSLHYQPIVSLEGGHTVGFEALLRWGHPRHGPVSPAEFIPLAEETGLIAELDRWVLAAGVRQLGNWCRRFREAAPTLSLNLSAQGLAQPGLVALVERLLLETGVDPAKLHLELTESMLVTHTERVLGTLHGLKALGVGLHIDDFGTGYSSLAYLQRFPVDTLKIDRSFVDKLTQSDSNAQLVRSIVSLAHALDLRVVAEGVETEGQLEALRALSCEFFQGFYASRPLGVAEAEAFLGRGGVAAPVSAALLAPGEAAAR